KNLRIGATQEKTFRAGEKVGRAQIDNNKMQYLYADGDSYVFMDNNSYEQLEIPASQLEHEVNYLKENMNVSIMLYEGETIGVELPKTVELEVIDTERGIKGDNKSIVYKTDKLNK